MKIKLHFIIIKLLKKQIMKNSKKNSRILMVALAALFITACTTVAHATEKKGNEAVSVKYVGAVNNAPIFQLSFTNEKDEKYIVKITDTDNTIYTETINGKAQVRKFQFVNNGSEDDILSVEIINVSTHKSITYKINPATHVEVETELVASL